MQKSLEHMHMHLLFSNYTQSLVSRLNSSFHYAIIPTTYQQVFLDVRSARLSAEGTIRTRGVGITPQTPARKKGPHGDKGKEFQARHGFYKLVMVLLLSPAAERIYCERNSTNNRVAFALTVSKCHLGSCKRQLNFSVFHYHRDRTDDFTELFLKEQYLGCTFSSWH